MRYLKTNTATRITVGPFLDKTDGVTPETALTVTSCHLTLMVDDGGVPTLVLDVAPTASAGSNDMVHVTNDDAGFYDLELAAANVNYVGRAMLAITDAATHCPVFHEFTILPAQVYDSLIGGTDLLDANASQLGGTSQTGRDVGASVLLSSGTGAGQIDFTSGVVKANLAQILGTALTETAGQIAAAFKKFFDKATPTGTINSLPDAVAGAAGGVFIAGTNAATSVTTALTANITGNLSGSVGSVTGAVGSVTARVTANTDQLAGQTVTAAAGVTFPTSIASPTNITAGTITTTTNLTNAPSDSSGVTTLLSRLSAARAGYLDNLSAGAAALEASVQSVLSKLLKYFQLALRKDAAIATDNATELTAINADGGSGAGAYSNQTDAVEAIRDRGDTAWITATGFSTLDAAGIRSAVGMASANLDTQLTAIDDYVDTEVTAIKAKTDLIPASPAASGDIPTAAAVADAVWDEAIGGHLTAGSTGNALNAAGSAGDPWSTSLPGAYGAGTAGKIVGDNVNATISSRSSHSAADVWSSVTRTLTAFSDSSGITTLLSRIASALTITGGKVDVNDKTGFSISGTKTTLDALNDLSAAQVNAEVVDALTVDLLADSVATDGTRPTMGQAVYEILQFLTEKSVSGTTLTVKKVDGTTALMTFTLNDATTPSSVTRAS